MAGKQPFISIKRNIIQLARLLQEAMDKAKNVCLQMVLHECGSQYISLSTIHDSGMVQKSNRIISLHYESKDVNKRSAFPRTYWFRNVPFQDYRLCVSSAFGRLGLLDMDCSVLKSF